MCTFAGVDSFQHYHHNLPLHFLSPDCWNPAPDEIIKFGSIEWKCNSLQSLNRRQAYCYSLRIPLECPQIAVQSLQSRGETRWAAGSRHCFWSRLISIDKMLGSNGIPLCHYGDPTDMDTCELTLAFRRVATDEALIRVRKEGERARDKQNAQCNLAHLFNALLP